MHRIVIMRIKFWFGMALLIAQTATMARGESTPPLTFHSGGTGVLRGDTNLVTLNRTFSEARAVVFEQFALTQVASLISRSLQFGSNAVPLVDALLTDTIDNEAVVTLGPQNSNSTSFIAAVRVNDQRRKLWNTNFSQLFGAPSVGTKDMDGTHWSIGSGGDFWTITKGDWLLFGHSSELAPLRAEYLQKIESDGSPVSALGTNWLEGDLNLGLLAPALPGWVKLLKPAPSSPSGISERGTTLKSKGRRLIRPRSRGPLGHGRNPRVWCKAH